MQRGRNPSLWLAIAFVATARIGVAAWTDPVLTPGQKAVRRVHFEELRIEINAERIKVGLGAFAWANPNLNGRTIAAVDLIEMRTAVGQALVQAGKPLPTYLQPNIVAGQTL